MRACVCAYMVACVSEVEQFLILYDIVDFRERNIQRQTLSVWLLDQDGNSFSCTVYINHLGLRTTDVVEL